MVFKVQDHYFKKAKEENFLARSVYKLEEIQQKYKVLKAGDQVLDLGYYPGSWVQYTLTQVGPQGRIVGVDLQPPHPRFKEMPHVQLLAQDLFNLGDLKDLSISSKFDVILSDMAPKTSGIKSLDQDRSLLLVERVFEMLPIFLKNQGHVVVKVFESSQAQDFLKAQKKFFKEFHYLRPKSTRSVSKEFFVIGKGYKGYEEQVIH